MERQPDSRWRDFIDSFYLCALRRLGVGAPDRGRIWRATPDNLVSLARQLMGQRAGTLARRRRRIFAPALTAMEYTVQLFNVISAVCAILPIDEANGP